MNAMNAMHRTNPANAPHRRLIAVGLAMAATASLTLAACGSSSPDSAATTSSAPTSSAPSSSAPDTTVPDTTDPGTTAPDTTAPATPAPTAPAPTGPTVTQLTTSSKTPSCADVTANGNQWRVSWKAVNVASVTLSIDGLGAYETGLPAQGSFNIPASCGDQQTVYITPVSAGGQSGTPKKIVINIGA